jgi:hypothetical protein
MQCISGSWRAWLRFKLGTSIFLIVLLCCALSMIAKRAREQRASVRAIERAGGRVFYDFEFTARSSTGVPTGEPWAPKPLLDLLGLDYFGHIVIVEFAAGASDREMPYVARLGRLETLNLHGSSVTSAGLEHLRALTRLEHLRLDRTKVTDEGLAHLSGLASLEDLNLNFTVVGDPGLVHLRALKHLSALGLEKTKVTSAGMRALRNALPDVQIFLGPRTSRAGQPTAR